ncbi:uncharacterized protein [Physeter macrocephalus]|uniref:Uncharacterized protein isoform X1 n=1 Tax=Physeter macrocephalus TaxID=9755 RepID=A0A9W2WSS1_PHYMC|nr:uncharacterized protein LOC114486617 isoform X1 [Physeter catodon]XP_054942184.1 uncharacterized protein LOC114486617 isoform X1 [Physeter catodon]XP_054942185.1 uncharacterized protein LOC114486617 isoform X1 [Physeter catodon]XP_054942186.1 uncharacterized protein LOC114486617 isoform X1 [Physeter catodon]XP_054942187.1 uncharacterized protein LOC114486617 isoform X1 [Physeter catodon]|eukprot:XP_028348063.1 uncharacterized protein LOC114486617 [Physeter catodon]
MKYSQHYSLGLPENRKGYGADRIVMNISLRTSVPHSEHFTECLHYAQAVTKQDAAPAAWELIKSRRSHMQITLKQSPSVVSLHLCFSMYLKVIVSSWQHLKQEERGQKRKLSKRRDTQAHREGHVKMEAEIGVMLSQAEECLQIPEAEKGSHHNQTHWIIFVKCCLPKLEHKLHKTGCVLFSAVSSLPRPAAYTSDGISYLDDKVCFSHLSYTKMAENYKGPGGAAPLQITS